MTLVAKNVQLQGFERNLYCNLEIPAVGLSLSCRFDLNGSALCVMWKRLKDDAPHNPSPEIRAFAEAAAEVEFRKASGRKVS